MKISTTVSHEIKFQVAAYWNEEGGMGYSEFGKEWDSLNKALIQLDLAEVSDPELDWKIVCNVTKQVKS